LGRAEIWALLLSPAVLCGQQFFPPGTLDNDARYSSVLKALHEPSLWDLSQQDASAEVYRFLWIRSFHHPIAVRLVVRPGGSGWLHVHVTSGQGGYEPGRTIRDRMSWMTNGKTQSLVRAFNNADFWNLPATNSGAPGTVGLDGAQWIFEGVQLGKYHVIDRWSPGPGDPVRGVGMLALELGRFRIRPQEIY